MSDLAGRIEDGAHRLELRIYFEDTDFSGIVYHANYLKYCERGRSDCLRLLGVHHHELAAQGLALAVRRMTLEFLKPARIDDVLTVETRFSGTTGVRCEIDQAVRRGADTLFTAKVTAVLLAKDGKPKRLPPRLLALAPPNSRRDPKV